MIDGMSYTITVKTQGGTPAAEVSGEAPEGTWLISGHRAEGREILAVRHSDSAGRVLHEVSSTHTREA